MKKILLLLAFFLACAAPAKPPVITPVPPPPVVVPPEPPQTQPVPPSPPQTQPVPVCGDSVLDPDCPKIVRDHKQWVSIGTYVAMMAQKDFNWPEYFKLFKKANATSIHLLTPWDEDKSGFKPWNRGSDGRADLTTVNEPWYTQVRSMMESEAYYDVAEELCFFDVYGETKWAKYGIPFHPFRWNNAKVDITSSSAQPLYYNWNRKMPFGDPKNWYWMIPTVDAHDQVLSVKGTNKLGNAIIYMVNRVVQIAKETKAKYPNFRLYVRPANESYAITEEDNKTLIPSKSMECDSRTESWIAKVFKDAGFKNSDSFKEVFEPECYVGNVTGPPCTYWTPRNSKYIKALGGMMEWHGVDDLTEYKKFISMGIDPLIFMASSDGSKEDATYYKRMRLIYLSKPPAFDYKLLGCYKSAPDCPVPWSKTNMNQNAKIFIPKMESQIFK